VYFRGRRGWVRKGGGKELVCILGLRVCVLVSVLIVKGVSGTRWWCVQLSLGASRIVGLEIWVDWFVGCWLQFL